MVMTSPTSSVVMPKVRQLKLNINCKPNRSYALEVPAPVVVLLVNERIPLTVVSLGADSKPFQVIVIVQIYPALFGSNSTLVVLIRAILESIRFCVLAIILGAPT